MLKRPLCIHTCFFILGVLLAFSDINILFTALATFILAVAIFLYRRKLIPFLFLCLVFLFGGIFLTNTAGNNSDLPKDILDGNSRTVNLTVTDFSGGENAYVKATLGGKTHKVYLNINEAASLSPGDTLRAEVIFSALPKGTAAGFYSYLRGRGIHLIGYTGSVEVTGKKTRGIDGFFYSIRRYIGTVGEKRFSGDTKALFCAMVLGDKHFMSDELSQKLQRAGLSHVAAVSGMHLSVVLAAITVLLQKIFGKRRRGSVISIAAVIIITVLTGAGASVMRASVMCLIYLTAKLLRREADSYTTLALTTLLMTAVNPFILYNVGFVLSVCAVLGILLFNKTVSRLISRFISGFFCDILSVTVSAQITTTFAVIYYFGIITPYSVLSNLLAALFANLTIILGIVLVIFSKVPFVGSVLAFAEEISSRAVIAVCDIIENLPLAVIEIKERHIFFLVYLFLFSLFIIRKTRFAVLRTTAVFSVLLLTVVSALMLSDNRINMHFPSNGTSAMSAVFLPDGESVLIDCVSSFDAENLLTEYGREKYDYVIFTSRYVGKVQNLIENGKVGTIVAAETVFDTPGGELTLKNALESGINAVTLSYGEVLSGKNVLMSLTPLSVSGNEKAAVQLSFADKSFAFLQAYNYTETEEIISRKIPIKEDFVILSDGDYHKTADFYEKFQYEEKINFK